LAVGAAVEVVDGAADFDDAGPPPVPDEHADRAIDPTMATIAVAVARRSGWMRMSSIYARLSAVMDRIVFQECCQAR
jgi:hypothetical protein